MKNCAIFCNIVIIKVRMLYRPANKFVLFMVKVHYQNQIIDSELVIDQKTVLNYSNKAGYKKKLNV